MTGLYLKGVKTFSGLYGVALLGAALTIPVIIAPVHLQAQGDRRDNQRSDQQNNRSYHDAKHNDDHQWNDREDQAFHMWAQENHRNVNDFPKLKARDQQSYWNWRHNHSDAQLKIE